MAGVTHAPAPVRRLTVNRAAVPSGIMADVANVEIIRGTEGQDAMTLAVQNKDQRYTRQRAFLRGMPIAFTGGMSGGVIRELFSGYIAFVLPRFGPDGSSISVICSPTKPASKEYREPHGETHEQVTPADAIASLIAPLNLALVNEATGPTALRNGAIRTSFYPRGNETRLQTAARIAREHWGVSFTVRGTQAIVRDLPAEQTATDALTLIWGKTSGFVSVEINETDDRPPQEIRATGTPARQNEAATGAEEAGPPWRETTAGTTAKPDDYQEGAQETEIAIRHDYGAATDADLDARAGAAAARSGQNEITVSVSFSGADPLPDGGRIRLEGVYGYEGSYYVAEVRDTFGSDGYSQSLSLSNRKPKASDSAGSSRSGRSSGGSSAADGEAPPWR